MSVAWVPQKHRWLSVWEVDVNMGGFGSAPRDLKGTACAAGEPGPPRVECELCDDVLGDLTYIVDLLGCVIPIAKV